MKTVNLFSAEQRDKLILLEEVKGNYSLVDIYNTSGIIIGRCYGSFSFSFAFQKIHLLIGQCTFYNISIDQIHNIDIESGSFDLVI